MIIIYILFSVSRSQSQLRLNYHSEQVTSKLHSPYTAEARARNGLEHRLPKHLTAVLEVFVTLNVFSIFVFL